MFHQSELIEVRRIQVAFLPTVVHKATSDTTLVTPPLLKWSLERATLRSEPPDRSG